MKKKIGLTAGTIAVILISLGYFWLRKNVLVEPPKYSPAANVVWLNQNWTAEQRDWFHHADQGTLTFGIPYELFMALEQPALPYTEHALLSDPEYLDRYGFIPSNKSSSVPELPIGFAHGGPILDSKGSPWKNPRTNKDVAAVGLTCAACHTGRFTYKNTAVLIDGGPGLLNLDEFQNEVGLSLVYTRYLGGFDRFAHRVLGQGSSKQAKSDLRNQMDPVMSQVWNFWKLTEKTRRESVEEGFTLIDALNRKGNAVFSIDLKNLSNNVDSRAPFSLSQILFFAIEIRPERGLHPTSSSPLSLFSGSNSRRLSSSSMLISHSPRPLNDEASASLWPADPIQYESQPPSYSVRCPGCAD